MSQAQFDYEVIRELWELEQAWLADPVAQQEYAAYLESLTNEGNENEQA